MPEPTNPSFSPGPIGLFDLLTAVKNLVIAVNTLNKTVTGFDTAGGVVLPQGAISGSAGAPTGTYLLITGPDGNQYKLQLLAVS